MERNNVPTTLEGTKIKPKLKNQNIAQIDNNFTPIYSPKLGAPCGKKPNRKARQELVKDEPPNAPRIRNGRKE